jgi:hypothetical protein
MLGLFFWQLVVLGTLEASGQIKTLVQTYWPHTSLIAEARYVAEGSYLDSLNFFSEFIAELYPRKFWDFIKATKKLEANSTDYGRRFSYVITIHLFLLLYFADQFNFLKSSYLANIINHKEELLDSLDLALGLREFSPSVELQRETGRKLLRTQ